MGPTPAMRFLLEFARVPMPSERVVPPDDMDWNDVLRLAAVHGMEPLMFRRFSTTGHDQVPSDVWDRIAAAQAENARRNLAATGELLANLRDLEAAAIPALSYKGPVLALQLYGDPCARRFGDLDVMVRPSQLRAARDVLLRHGFTTDLELGGWQFDEFVESQKELAFIHERTHQEVDLQWVITERSFGLRWDMPGLWARAVRVEVGGLAVRTFARNDLALILCVHGTTHLWERLGWIADLGRLIEAGEVNWAAVILEARRLGAERMVLCSIALADRMTGCGVPGPAALRRSETTSRLMQQLRDRIVSADRAEIAHADRPFHPLLARLRDGPIDQVTYVAGLAFTPTVGDWNAIALPRALRFLYVLVRPVRLAFRYARWIGG